MRKLLLVRPFANIMDISSYNSQEIGLCKAFCKRGFDCDIVYFSSRNYEEVVFRDGKRRIKIIWRNGIKFGTRVIYMDFLNPFKLWKYDVVISNEYEQVMSVLLALLHRNVYIYNGPYFTTFEDGKTTKIYDRICVPICNRCVRQIFSKTRDATEFLRDKGLKKLKTIGVGLDTEKFGNKADADGKVLDKGTGGMQNILYVGTAERRKRLGHIFKVFEALCATRDDVKLIIAGRIQQSESNRLLRLLSPDYRKRVCFLGKVDNSQIAGVYQNSVCSVLASDEEIFGMTVLESMYFMTPCIAKDTAGPKNIIDHQKNGILESDYNIIQWKSDIEYLLDHPDVRDRMGIEARKKILSEFTWEKVVYKMFNNKSRREK